MLYGIRLIQILLIVPFDRHPVFGIEKDLPLQIIIVIFSLRTSKYNDRKLKTF